MLPFVVHRNSYTTEFFVPVDNVIGLLRDEGSIWVRESFPSLS